MRLYIGSIEFSDKPDDYSIPWDGIEGLYSLPSLKTEAEERTGKTGAFKPRTLDYNARVLTIHGRSRAKTREEHIALWEAINALHLTTQTIRVVDREDTFLIAGIETEFPAGKVWRNASFTVTATCYDPFRYATEAQSLFLQSQSVIESGLDWGDGDGLIWPLDWGQSGMEGNTGIIRNDGNAIAYPTITITGNLPSGATIRDDLGRALVYDGPILPSVPLVLNCRDQYATVGGANRSQFLTYREWIDVAPGGDRTLSYIPHTAEEGWAQVEIRDTYI